MERINLTKDEFLQIMDNIREQKRKIEEFGDAIQNMCSGYVVFNADDKYYDALLYTLSKMFHQQPNHEFNTIEWYLEHTFDNSHIMICNGRELNVNTDELLYELLVAEFDQKVNNTSEKMDDLFEKYGKESNDKDIQEMKQISISEAFEILLES